MAMMQFFAIARRMMTTPVNERRAFASYMSTSSLSSIDAGAPVVCGRGDKRTKKGKRFKGSYGNSRPKKEKKIERIKDKLHACTSIAFNLLYIERRSGFFLIRKDRS